MKYSVDWEAVRLCITIILASGTLGATIFIMAGRFPASAPHIPARLAMERLPINLREFTRDGSAPPCSSLVWRDTGGGAGVYSAVCFGVQGEFLVEYAPGARSATVIQWNP